LRRFSPNGVKKKKGDPSQLMKKQSSVAKVIYGYGVDAGSGGCGPLTLAGEIVDQAEGVFDIAPREIRLILHNLAPVLH